MKLLGLLLSFTPRRLLSRITGRLVSLRRPQMFARWAMKRFASHYQIRLEEAEFPFESYRSISELFTRRLKPGIRPIGAGLVHPVDGKISSSGPIEDRCAWQIKGWNYSIDELLWTRQDLSSFYAGHFATYYLCPTDYHRVHSPVNGKITRSVHIPGTLWPVNDWSVQSIPRLFCINERIVMWIDTPTGKVALVMVGATNVGKMTLSFDGAVVSNRPTVRSPQEKFYPQPIDVKKGDELGTFHMGSTVVVIFEKGGCGGPDFASKQIRVNGSKFLVNFQLFLLI